MRLVIEIYEGGLWGVYAERDIEVAVIEAPGEPQQLLANIPGFGEYARYRLRPVVVPGVVDEVFSLLDE